MQVAAPYAFLLHMGVALQDFARHLVAVKVGSRLFVFRNRQRVRDLLAGVRASVLWRTSTLTLARLHTLQVRAQHYLTFTTYLARVQGLGLFRVPLKFHEGYHMGLFLGFERLQGV